jgi:hypothetical protein
LTANFSNLVSFFLAPGDKLPTTSPIRYLPVNHASVAKDLIALAAITTDSATYGVCPSVIALREFNLIISPTVNIESNRQVQNFNTACPSFLGSEERCWSFCGLWAWAWTPGTAIMEWRPQEDGLKQLAEYLRDSLGGFDRPRQKQAEIVSRIPLKMSMCS